MSELPERKVLKEMLVKLKAKVFNSQKNLALLSATMNETMTKELKDSRRMSMSITDSNYLDISRLIVRVIETWWKNFNLLNANLDALVGHMNLYIETLEKYSTELDSTLTDIFKKAEEQYKKQLEQQEELRKKEPSYRA